MPGEGRGDSTSYGIGPQGISDRLFGNLGSRNGCLRVANASKGYSGV
jgi:hypothetical protein